LTLVVLSLAMVVADHRTTALDPLRTALATAVSPLIFTAHLPYAALEAAGHWRATVDANRRLSRELSRQAIALQRLSALEAENARLRALLGSAERVQGRERFAAVIGVTPDPRRSQLIVDRGDGQGIGLGDAVLGAEGLVGQVIETGALSSRVLLIDDLAHSTPVVVLRNGLRALAQGQGPGVPLSVPYLSSQDDIRLGDVLVTSGLGGRFPPGYPVARVIAVEGSTSEAFLNVQAEPLTPLRRLQDVVVLSVAGGQRPPWDQPLGDAR
jgi:rod shape-determining protein MreC